MRPSPITSVTKAKLRILQTTDLHMCLLPYDYVSDSAVGAYGLARLAPTLADLRNQGVTSCLFDTGDFLQGNQLADFVMTDGAYAGTHPMIAAMNLLGYDAVSLGNHEFDYGADALHKTLEDLDCPAVLANIVDKQGKPFIAPTAIITREINCDDGLTRDLRIGVIGLVTPQTTFTEGPSASVQLETRDIIESARHYAPLLRAAGADLIVALCHCGIGDSVHHPGMDNAAVPLAALPEIDVLLTGHVHHVFPDPLGLDSQFVDVAGGTIHGKPAVMAGAYGSHIGKIDLELGWSPEGWSIQSHTVNVISMSCMPERPDANSVAIAASVNHLHQETLRYIRQPIGETLIPIHSYFSQIVPDSSLQLLSDAKIAAISDMISGTRYGDLPVLAATAPYRSGGRAGPNHFVNIPAGPVTLRDVRAIYPFSNRLCAIRCNGAQIRTWLEHAARRYHQIRPGQQDAPLLNQQIAAYHSDTIFGVTYDIDLAQAPGAGRIVNLQYDGQAVTDADIFALAISSYRLNGGGGYPATGVADVIFESARSTYDHVISYLRDAETVNPIPQNVWRFVPMKDTSVRFRSSPHAVQYLDGPETQNITALDQSVDGFRLYRMTL